MTTTRTRRNLRKHKEAAEQQMAAEQLQAVEQQKAARPRPPKRKPVIPALKKHLIQKDKEIARDIGAARKHRGWNCLLFNSNLSKAIPGNKTFHVVEMVERKDGRYIFKYNTPNSLLSELEAMHWSYFHLLEPEIVSEKVNVHFKPDGTYIGLSVKLIDGYKSLTELPLNREDLKNPEIIKGLAISMTLSWILGEADLHRGNQSKLGGKRIDFDMLMYEVSHQFKAKDLSWFGLIKHKFTRDFDPERFMITAEDIDNFPDIKHAPYYWPTQPSPVPETILTNLPDDHPVVRNSYPQDENELFRELKNIPLFHYYKFKTMLKFLLVSDESYRTAAKPHVRPDKMGYDKHGEFKPILDIEIEWIHERKEKLRSILVKMSSFQDFLLKHGEQARAEILEELEAHNKAVIQADIKRQEKHPDSNATIMIDDLINLEEVSNNYSSIFEEFKLNITNKIPGSTYRR